MKKFVICLLLVVFFATGTYLGCMVLISIDRFPPNEKVRAELVHQGELLIGAIEEYHSVHSVYPADLLDLDLPARVQIVHPIYGPWKYVPYEDGTGFRIKLGDYGKHLIELHWDSDSRNWYVDT
ncbi:MAG: hypothetical protein WDZ59_08125 [Pirellulales bacterium]